MYSQRRIVALLKIAGVWPWLLVPCHLLKRNWFGFQTPAGGGWMVRLHQAVADEKMVNSLLCFSPLRPNAIIYVRQQPPVRISLVKGHSPGATLSDF